MLNGINHITIAVSDLERSLDFYVNHLGFTPHVRWDAGAYITLGETWFCLSIDCVSPGNDYSHIALDISEDNFDSFCTRLQSIKTIEWKQNSSEGNSIYFLDPDGHKLEVHSGSLQSRLDELRKNPYQGFECL